MGLFDFLRKKEVAERNVETIKNNEVIVRKNPPIEIHEDLKGLIWFGDGPLQNYTNENIAKNTFEVYGIKLIFRMSGDEEPSLIYTKQHIVIPNDITLVERPPYYPTYSGLTPEQKGVYIKLLQNPYNPDIDIGFVFILYYGLERHLLCGDFEKAYKVILKLRDAHSNKSFQSYSANALVLISMFHQRGEIALDFIKSIDKDYEFSFSGNLFLLCYYSFNIPLTAKDVMRMARTFEFTNLNYLKRYPELFQETLENEIINKTKDKTIQIAKYLNRTDIAKLSTQEIPIFANTSIRDKSFPVPLLSENFKLKKELNIFLEKTHELVKQKVAEMRKAGTLQDEKVETKPKNLPVFNQKEENDLLATLNSAGNDLVNKHFKYLNLQNFYYKYRNLDEKYINKCIEYCLLDIDILPEMEKQYIENEIRREEELAKFTGKPFSKEDENRIRKEGFAGRIPAFSRLSIIYEKQKQYEKALEICDIAINFKHEADEYLARKETILKKMNKV